jgi:hypothetical protein
MFMPTSNVLDQVSIAIFFAVLLAVGVLLQSACWSWVVCGTWSAGCVCARARARVCVCVYRGEQLGETGRVSYSKLLPGGRNQSRQQLPVPRPTSYPHLQDPVHGTTGPNYQPVTVECPPASHPNCQGHGHHMPHYRAQACPPPPSRPYTTVTKGRGAS